MIKQAMNNQKINTSIKDWREHLSSIPFDELEEFFKETCNESDLLSDARHPESEEDWKIQAITYDMYHKRKRSNDKKLINKHIFEYLKDFRKFVCKFTWEPDYKSKWSFSHQQYEISANVDICFIIKHSIDIVQVLRLITTSYLDLPNPYYIKNKTIKVVDSLGNNLLIIKPNNINRTLKITDSFSLREKTITEYLIVFAQENNRKVAFKYCDNKDVKQIAEKYIYCYLENYKINIRESMLNNILLNRLSNVTIDKQKESVAENIAMNTLLCSSYNNLFVKKVICYYNNGMMIIDYQLPTVDCIGRIKEYKHIASRNEISTKEYSSSYLSSLYDKVLYSICLRSIYEVFITNVDQSVKSITFNGIVSDISKATGCVEEKCIISLQVSRDVFLDINLSLVDPILCFKSLKGVSSAKLINLDPVTPLLRFNKDDKRFVEGKHIETNQGSNLAAMDWEDFEHLVRELFESEFSQNGAEVKVTQASRDGGVDAIVFDPDPLRGGKIVIQAKRYTNTVSVSAVRDLYGTVINEGANTGILITTSDYGHDSYEFAKDKPLKLLNGGHLLSLLKKNHMTGYINIKEAKETLKQE